MKKLKLCIILLLFLYLKSTAQDSVFVKKDTVYLRYPSDVGAVTTTTDYYRIRGTSLWIAPRYLFRFRKWKRHKPFMFSK